MENNVENEIYIENIEQNSSEEIETNTIQEDSQTQVTLDTIHNDLGVICSFLSIASVLVFSIIIYKFFRIFF